MAPARLLAFLAAATFAGAAPPTLAQSGAPPARSFGPDTTATGAYTGEGEGEDLRSLVGQVVDDPRFAADAGSVGVFGASYGGAHSWLAALKPTCATRGRATPHPRGVGRGAPAGRSR